MKLKWNEHYAMGIEAIDNDHKQLFQIAGKIIETVEDRAGMSEHARLFVVREGVKYLKNYFLEHAFREEAYMRQIGYEDYEAHKRLHDEFRYVQLARFEEIIERGMCTKKEVYDFVGVGIGWLLEHISTADMAIVGKGVLCQPKILELNEAVLEREVNMLFIATLNLNVNAKIIQRNYRGEPFGEAVYQEYTYRRGNRPLTVISGIEKSFLLSVANMVYGDDIGESDGLILSTLEVFGGNFWRTLGERLIRSADSVEFKENHFLSQKQLQERFLAKVPAISVLFQSEKGKFFLASEDESWNRGQKAVG
ncbi:MAG: bacteriohemerythrin [Lawsonibacter sp.]